MRGGREVPSPFSDTRALLIDWHTRGGGGGGLVQTGMVACLYTNQYSYFIKKIRGVRKTDSAVGCELFGGSGKRVNKEEPARSLHFVSCISNCSGEQTTKQTMRMSEHSLFSRSLVARARVQLCMHILATHTPSLEVAIHLLCGVVSVAVAATAIALGELVEVPPCSACVLECKPVCIRAAQHRRSMTLTAWH